MMSLVCFCLFFLWQFWLELVYFFGIFKVLTVLIGMRLFLGVLAVWVVCVCFVGFEYSHSSGWYGTVLGLLRIDSYDSF